MNPYVLRISELMHAMEINSVRELSSKCNINEGTLAKQMRDDRAVSLDTIDAILANFPDVSAEWLLRGKGELLLSEQPEDKPEDVGLLKRLLNNLLGTCEDQRKQIERLEQLKDLAASKE